MTPGADPAALLGEIHAKVVVCVKCRLSEGRTLAVPGEGAPNAQIVFVGEAPGREEDLEGRPFVGAAGKLLTRLLSEIGIQRSEVFITNVVKCRPPGNRDPLPDEIAACRPYLLGQLRAIRPRAVCTLGRFAAHTLIDPGLAMSNCHGRSYRKNGVLLVPLLHPAAALHNQEWLGVMHRDMGKLKLLLKRELA